MLSAIMMSVVNRYAAYRYADCQYAECCYAERRYDERRYAECHGAEPFDSTTLKYKTRTEWQCQGVKYQCKMFYSTGPRIAHVRTYLRWVFAVEHCLFNKPFFQVKVLLITIIIHFLNIKLVCLSPP